MALVDSITRQLQKENPENSDLQQKNLPNILFHLKEQTDYGDADKSETITLMLWDPRNQHRWHMKLN